MMTLEEIIPLLPEAKVTENNRMTDDFCQKFTGLFFFCLPGLDRLTAVSLSSIVPIFI